MSCPRPVSRTRSFAGFTLLELVVAVVVISILAAIAIPSLRNSVNRSQDASAVTELQILARSTALQTQFNSPPSFTEDDVRSAALGSGLQILSAGQPSEARGAVSWDLSDPEVLLLAQRSGSGACVQARITVAEPQSVSTNVVRDDQACNAGLVGEQDLLAMAYPQVNFLADGSPQSFTPDVLNSSGSLQFSLAGTLPAGVEFDSGTGQFSTAGLLGTVDGTRDQSFNAGADGAGAVGSAADASNAVRSVVVIDSGEHAGKILIGGAFAWYSGSSAPYLIRVNADGTRDTTFNAGGSGPNASVLKVALIPAGPHAGKIMVGGAFTTYNGVTTGRIIRLNADGSRDTAFSTGGTGPNDWVYDIDMVESGTHEGKAIVTGVFTSFSGTATGRVVRLNTDGSRDTTFNTGGTGAANTIYAADIVKVGDHAGKILIGGEFTTYNGVTSNRIARLNADGTRDTTFNSGGTSASGAVWTLISLTEGIHAGKTVLGGGFLSFNGVTVNRIARLNADGTRDTAFNSGGTGADATVRVIEDIPVGPDAGKLMVGGNFTTYNGSSITSLMRLNADGGRDSGFAPGVINASVRTMSIPMVGTLAGSPTVGGEFTSFGGFSAGRIVRLAVADPAGFPATVSVSVSDDSGSTATVQVTLTVGEPLSAGGYGATRMVAAWWPHWHDVRASSLPAAYDTVIVAAARAVGGAPGTTGAVFYAHQSFSDAVVKSDIASMRNLGRTVLLLVGGSTGYVHLDTRARSQAFVDSIAGIYAQIGPFDGIDLNLETSSNGYSLNNTELIWIGQQLKGTYGNNFIISMPPAPGHTPDRVTVTAMHDAGVLDLVIPQYYGGSSTTINLAAPSYIANNLPLWVAAMGGDASKVALGLMPPCPSGCHTSPDVSTQQMMVDTWNAEVSRYPSLRGTTLWSTLIDERNGWWYAFQVAAQVRGAN
jgi:uncharacterized delta-60 repeat protein/prepilin-type N-terminal cleavage/methylation domain-containing protein